MSVPLRIDARGLRCPWPAIRLARALRGNARVVEVLADDPAAARELTALATAANAVITAEKAQGATLYRVDRLAVVDPLFT